MLLSGGRVGTELVFKNVQSSSHLLRGRSLITQITTRRKQQIISCPAPPASCIQRNSQCSSISTSILSLQPQVFHGTTTMTTTRRQFSSSSAEIEVLGKCYTCDEHTNVTPEILSKVGHELHKKTHHPLGILQEIIEKFFIKNYASDEGKPLFEVFRDSHPVVTTTQNFDDLLIPPDHVSRRRSDTYYLNQTKLLRTHTSAHQTEHIRKGSKAFLATGDVYRRDEIDASHYPVFHQMEGVRIFERKPGQTDEEFQELCAADLKSCLEGLARSIFGNVEIKWVNAYFPFTTPSFEMEIFFNGKWLEVLGCGVIQQSILDSCGLSQHKGWAFGLGLERWAMVRFDIPDIRLFWSQDPRFLSQFQSGKLDVRFKTYSKYPPCYKDISFWLPASSTSPSGGNENGVTEGFHQNDFFEVIRSIAGDLVEDVVLIDEFVHPKTKRQSKCFRINYRSMDKNLTNEEIDLLQVRVRQTVEKQLGFELR